MFPVNVRQMLAYAIVTASNEIKRKIQENKSKK